MEAATAELYDSTLPEPSPLRLARTHDASKENNMPPRRHEADTETDDLAVIREATHSAMLAITSMAKAIEAQQPKSKLNGLTTPLFSLFGVIVVVFGLKYIPASDADFKFQIQEAKTQASEAKRDAGDAAREAKKANLNNALLDTYNRELERALIRRGIALPTYPVLEK